MQRPSIDANFLTDHVLRPWLQAIGLAIAFALLLIVAPARADNDVARGLPEDPPARIEVAFVLDTTGSMTGLIDGAKRKIWSIANNLIDLEPTPEIRFALIGYRDRGDAYVTQTFDLTNDVQNIYGKLLAFQADGGGDTPESVNQALFEAVNHLSWSQEEQVFRVIFLVGDAPPQMNYPDDTPYTRTLEIAEQRDILVNAIQAGSMRRTTPIWREIAALGGGDYVRIAQDGGMIAIETPYDAAIQALRRRISDTVLPYGEAEAETRSKLADALSAADSVSSDMAGYLSKSGDGVITGAGDLVQDVIKGAVSLEELDNRALPAPMREMTAAQQRAYLDERARERAEIQAEIDRLVATRDLYLRDHQAELGQTDAFDSEVRRMIVEQSSEKGFRAKSE